MADEDIVLEENDDTGVLNYRASTGQRGASLLSLVLRDHDGRVGGVRRRGSPARV
jgi:hypothetical protein